MTTVPEKDALNELLHGTLKGVSRAFYLSLRVLPPAVRRPVSLAYLIARAMDTICDTEVISTDLRLGLIQSVRGQVQGLTTDDSTAHISTLYESTNITVNEMTLLRSLPTAISLLETLPTSDRELVRGVVVTLSHGIEIDLVTFPPKSPGELTAFQSLAELDRYTYYVAGCVGEFWTEMAILHTKSLSGWNLKMMSEFGIRFGKALQMTNILRDIPKDISMGRCYIPKAELSAQGLMPTDLLDSSQRNNVRGVVSKLTNLTLDHYTFAARYLFSIPRTAFRLRIATVWPMVMGLATLAELAKNDWWVDQDTPVKVSRRWVYGMIAISVPCTWSNTLLRVWVNHLFSNTRKRMSSTPSNTKGEQQPPQEIL